MLDQILQRLQQHQPWHLKPREKQAGVLVALTREAQPKVILTLRSRHLSTHRGEISFPGGKVEPKDRDIIATALRETDEEVGLEAPQVEIVGRLSDVISKHGLQVTPCVGVFDPAIRLRANPGEIERIFRVQLSFFLENDPIRHDAIATPKRSLNIPAWEYEGEVIWGLTAYVLTELLNVTLDANISTALRPEHGG